MYLKKIKGKPIQISKNKKYMCEHTMLDNFHVIVQLMGQCMFIHFLR